MKKAKRIIAILLALCLIFALTACGASDKKEETKTDTPSADSDGDVIKIGVFEPSSGQNGAGGKKEILGIQYANSLYNTVELDGKEYTIELVYADNQSDSSVAPSAAQSLLSAGVSVVVGTYGSGCAIAAGDLFADAKVPAIGTSCTNPQVTLDNDYYFRVCYIDPFQGQVMATYAANQGCTNTAVIVEAGDDYSAGFGNYFSSYFTSVGGKCQTIEFQTGETDFSAIMAKLATQNIDAIFCPVSIETAPFIIKDAREAGLGLILAGDTWDDVSIAERAGDAATDIYFSCFFDATDNSNAAAAEFVKGFKAWINEDSQRLEDNGGTDEISSVTPCGYDAYMAAYNALKEAGSLDGETIRDTLANLQVSGLVTGDLSFDENGDAVKTYVAIKTYKDGTTVFHDSYNG